MKEFHTRSEEYFHSLTHGIGAVLAAVGAVYLISDAIRSGDPWRIVSFGIYGVTLVGLYTTSTLYHGVRSRRLKRRLRLLDHSAIYFFIAGSFTPFLLIPLRGSWGWIILGLTWGMAIGGVVYKVMLLDRFPRVSTLLYLGMSWLGLLLIIPLFDRLATSTLGWLVAGGLIYTAGTAIFHLNWVRYAHVVWHLFVLGGSICHFVAITQL